MNTFQETAAELPARYARGQAYMMVLLLGLLVVYACVRDRMNRPAPAVPVPADDPPAAPLIPADGDWAGAWLLRREPPDNGFGLPLVEVGRGRSPIGRVVLPGPGAVDVEHRLEHVRATAPDTLELTTFSRLRYRLVRTAPGTADLYALADPALAVERYLADRTRDARDELLDRAAAPREPARVGTLERVALKPPTAPDGTPGFRAGHGTLVPEVVP